MIRNNTLYIVRDDQLGPPDTVTNTAGAVVWRASNFAYDRTVTTDNIGGLNLGFPGQYYDSESGLWYNWNRYYDPTTGRYIQSDPIGLAGGSNTYVYTGSNPLSRIDPLGLANLTIAGGISVEPVFGFEGSIGFYLSTDPLDVGTLYSSGLGVGYNNGISAFASYIPGSKDDISGNTTNVNVAAGPACSTYSTSNGKFSGVSIGFAEGPAGVSVSNSNTVITGSLRNGLLAFGQGLLRFFNVPRGD